MDICQASGIFPEYLQALARLIVLTSKSSSSARFGLHDFLRLQRGPYRLEYFLVRLYQQWIVGPCCNVLASVYVCVVRNVFQEHYLCTVCTSEVHYWTGNVSNFDYFG